MNKRKKQAAVIFTISIICLLIGSILAGFPVDKTIYDPVYICCTMIAFGIGLAIIGGITISNYEL